MSEQPTTWIAHVRAGNAAFLARIDRDKLPVARTPGSVAVITCMDPRVNLEALGIPGFDGDGGGTSPVRIIRTIGGMAEERSLIVGLFLAGIREIAVVMHTDCGCCLAYSKIDTIVENMAKRLTAEQFTRYQAEVGEPFADKLRARLKAFEDPRAAVQREVASIRALPYVPPDVVVHGLLYELATGRVEVVVDGTAG